MLQIRRILLNVTMIGHQGEIDDEGNATRDAADAGSSGMKFSCDRRCVYIGQIIAEPRPSASECGTPNKNLTSSEVALTSGLEYNLSHHRSDDQSCLPTDLEKDGNATDDDSESKSSSSSSSEAETEDECSPTVEHQRELKSHSISKSRDSEAIVEKMAINRTSVSGKQYTN